MAASKGGIIGKSVLLLLAMVLLAVVMGSDSALYTTQSTDPTKGEVGFSEELHYGIGLFKTSSGAAVPGDFKTLQLSPYFWGTWINCDEFGHLWRGMQAAAVIAMIGMLISLIITLTYFGNQDEKFARNCCGCLGDVMALVGGSALIVLMVVNMKVSACDDFKTNTEDDIFGTSAGSLDVRFDLAFGIYLASFSFLFAAISLCIGLVAKRGGGGGNNNNQPSYQEMQHK